MSIRGLTINLSVVMIVLIMAIQVAAGSKQSTAESKNNRTNLVQKYTLNSFQQVDRSADFDRAQSVPLVKRSQTRRPVGSALSPEVGIGKGASVDLTFDDAQHIVGQGRHLSHWWNGEYGGNAEVSVHFGYSVMDDTVSGGLYTMTGYNVYDAIAGDWPRTQDGGCDLQSADTAGWGGPSSLDIMANGRIVMTAMSHLSNGTLGDGSAYVENMQFFQAGEFNCSYAPAANVTSIDSTDYRQHYLDQTDGNYSRAPQIVTQWDGSNTVVHLLLFEDLSTPLSGPDYAEYYGYRTAIYYRKVGETAASGSWGNAQVIDSLQLPWASMAAASFPNPNVAVVYTNPSFYGALLNNPFDLDVWYRESLDRGLSWETAVDFTQYQNGVAGDPNHFTAWIESQCLYTDDGDLHVVWTAAETSADPYFDGYNWSDFNMNVYHWSRNNDNIIEVADGSWGKCWDLWNGSCNTLHCGFGGSNAGYLANVNISQCDDKLYCIWNQIHERALRFEWRDAETIPAPGVLDDCSYTGERLAMANWEIMMSVMRLADGYLWDHPRNISDTYTPDCGLPGDPEASGLCGSEYRPSVEKHGLDETGLALTWPSETLVDMTPEAEGPYTGNWFLNLQYVDDQFPGPAYWGWTNPPGTYNSIKWIRLACVEPVYQSQISIDPDSFDWPDWVEFGQTTNLTVTVRNNGNMPLDITEIGIDDDGNGWLSVSENPTPGAPFQVPAGAVNTATFDIIVDATGRSSNWWLDGEIWLKSNAINEDSTPIMLHILAAADIEPVVWDTVQSHAHMFDIYLLPGGECVALAVSNHGEVGYGAGTSGSVNLDYYESEMECGQRFADKIYLRSGTVFTILADDAAGSNAELTSSYNDSDQADESGWDPVGDIGSMSGGLTASGVYDSVWTGRFVNRDTTIAMERIFYMPRPQTGHPEDEILNFTICLTKIYSGDGAAHDHLTLGSVVDWDLPSENRYNENTTGLVEDFLYVQGTDTTAFLSCQEHSNRYATEAFGGGYTSEEWEIDSCVNNVSSFYSINALSQTLLEDTTHYRDGSPLVPAQANPAVWWDETGQPGMNPGAGEEDFAVWMTWRHDYNLGANDTLYFWTVLSTVRNGSLADLEAQVDYAKDWYTVQVRGCDLGCCEGRVGDANGSGGDEPTIGDISVMIDAKFITGRCEGIIPCLAEADINQSGGINPTCDDITIGDIAALIDCLFITGPSCRYKNPCLSNIK